MCLTKFTLVLLTIQLNVLVVIAKDNYTANEVTALEKFRPLIAHLLTHDYEKQDIFRIHWLRATELDVPAAKKMLEEAVAWRKENNIDEILDDPKIKKNRNLYYYAIGSSVDKEGRPTLEALFSIWDVRKSVLLGHNMDKYMAHMFEGVTRVAFKSRHSHWNYLVDMNNYSIRQHGCLGCLKFYIDLVTHLEKHYPNTVNVIYLVNTPKTFELILNSIRYLFSPHTKNALKIFGVNKAEWLPVMLKLYDANQLTRPFGGTKPFIHAI